MINGLPYSLPASSARLKTILLTDSPCPYRDSALMTIVIGVPSVGHVTIVRFVSSMIAAVDKRAIDSFKAIAFCSFMKRMSGFFGRNDIAVTRR